MSDDIIKLIRDLSEVGRVTPKRAEQVIQQAALKTKKHWADAAAIGTGPRSGAVHRQYARKIDYDTESGGGQFTAEIGATRGGAGSFGAWDDPISAGVRIRPSRARRSAAKFAEADLDKGIQKAVDQTLRDAGL